MALLRSDAALAKTIIQRGDLTEAALQAYLTEAAGSKEGLYQILLKKGALDEERLLKALAESQKLKIIELHNLKPDPAAVEKVPLKIAEYYRVAPVRFEKRKLIIAVSSPMDLRTQDDIRAHLGYEVEMVLAREKEIAEVLKRFYGFAAGTIGEIVAQQQAQGTGQAAQAPVEAAVEKIDVEKMAGDATIAKLVNQIILEAYRKRATDIHIEPYRGKVKLRYRIDGVLYNANVQPEINRLIMPILSRVKILSNLNIVEKRLPQDGRAIVKVEDATLDLRVSSIPTSYGESVVIRMLPMNRIFSLTQLGLSAQQLEAFERLVAKPHGVIFITGPTGSGKSTTLYACLNKINTDERKIITIEDPVEYEMEGVTQIQVQSEIGLTFARGLRSMLRHDPDVMMVGEVRDLETAEIAIRVALTGHLVLSTIHTNDAASGVTRLLDIGVEPYLVASSLEAFVAQRLIRLICQHCKEEDKKALPDAKRIIARELGLRPDESMTLFRGKGCNHCNQTGFWGRMAIYEILLFNEKVRQLVMRRATAGDIKRAAVQSGMRTLKQDGLAKALQGLTTPEEVMEVVEQEKENFPDTSDRALPEEPGAGQSARLFERRIFLRLDHSVNIRYKVVKPAARKTEEFTVTRNISAGGLVFAARESFPPGTIFELKIELPGEEKPIECLARVVRDEEIEPEKSYEMAVCFLDLSADDRGRLDRFVVGEAEARKP